MFFLCLPEYVMLDVLWQNGAFWGGYKCTIDPKTRPTILRGHGSLLKYLLTADSVFPIDYWLQ